MKSDHKKDKNFTVNSNRIRSKKKEMNFPLENRETQIVKMENFFLPGTNQNCFHEILNSALLYIIKERFELSNWEKGNEVLYWGR